MTTPAPSFEDVKDFYEDREEVFKSIQSGKCVCIVGAGATRDVYGSWWELLDAITKKIDPEDRKTIENEDYKVWADNLFAENPAASLEVISEKFLKNSPPTPCCEKLAALPFKGYLTTNWDLLLLKAIGEKRPNRPKTHTYPSLDPFKIDGNSVYFIHGGPDPSDNSWNSFYPEGLIFTKSQYDNAYGLAEKALKDQTPSSWILPSFLMNIFLHNDVLFVGSGMDPSESFYDIISYAQKAYETLKLHPSVVLPYRRWALVPKGKVPNTKTVDAKIQLLSYEYKKDDHSKLYEALESLRDDGHINELMGRVDRDISENSIMNENEL